MTKTKHALVLEFISPTFMLELGLGAQKLWPNSAVSSENLKNETS